MYIFFHIPKTGGSSLDAILASWLNTYSEYDFSRNKNVEDFDDDDCLTGHFNAALVGRPAALFNQYPWMISNPNVRVLTMMRHPVERAISFFYHQKRLGYSGSIESFFDNSPLSKYSINYGVNCLADDIACSFFFVGVMERFEKLVKILSERVGKQSPSIFKINSRNRNHDEDDSNQKVKLRLEQSLTDEVQRYTLFLDSIDNPSQSRLPSWSRENQFSFLRNNCNEGWSKPMVYCGFINSEKAFIKSVASKDKLGIFKSHFFASDAIGIEINFSIAVDSEILQPTLMVEDIFGAPLFSVAFTRPEAYLTTLGIGKYSACAWIPGNLLSPGEYAISVTISNPINAKRYSSGDRLLRLRIADLDDEYSARGLWRTPFPTYFRPLLSWDLCRKENNDSHE